MRCSTVIIDKGNCKLSLKRNQILTAAHTIIIHTITTTTNHSQLKKTIIMHTQTLSKASSAPASSAANAAGARALTAELGAAGGVDDDALGAELLTGHA